MGVGRAHERTPHHMGIKTAWDLAQAEAGTAQQFSVWWKDAPRTARVSCLALEEAAPANRRSVQASRSFGHRPEKT